MNVLVTGGAGFIGSNFVQHMLKQHRDVYIVNLDKLTYAGSLEYLQEIMDDPRHTFVHGDICDRSLVEHLFEQHQIDGVIHFAAESHVDQSIRDPRSFVETNVLGTLNLLEAARTFWMEGIGQYKRVFQQARFHHISTDEVYGTLGAEGLFTEKTAYAPNSPYSASKASSDMMVRSYFHTYGMNVVTTNCSNNYGPKQHEEKLIPTIIRKALALDTIPIYGDGQNVRDWLYVLDHCRAIEQVFVAGRAGETYLVGGHCEKTNMEIALTICDILDQEQPVRMNEKGITSYRQLLSFVADRPGHDFRYAIDDSKLRRELGFERQYLFDQGIRETISYYVEAFSLKRSDVR